MGDQNRNPSTSQSAGQREPNQPTTQANNPNKTPMRDDENRQQPTGQREEDEEE